MPFITFFAKVVLPEPDPPAIPIRNIFPIRIGLVTKNTLIGEENRRPCKNFILPSLINSAITLAD
jgi:hypothetical protein